MERWDVLAWYTYSMVPLLARIEQKVHSLKSLELRMFSWYILNIKLKRIRYVVDHMCKTNK